MHNGLNYSNPGDMSVENVESLKAPTGEPDENVVPASEYPEPWQIVEADNTGSI